MDGFFPAMHMRYVAHYEERSRRWKILIMRNNDSGWGQPICERDQRYLSYSTCCEAIRRLEMQKGS